MIALSAWINVVLRIRYPASQRLKSSYAFMMLGFDVLQLSALLYLTGGLENPFAFLLIAPVAVSASTLRLRVTAALGLMAITLATLLTSFHHPLPWFHHSNLLLPFPYVMGVWAALVSSILFIGFYSWRTAEEARRMSEALAAAEMVLAREQKLSALDGLAAAAAHGLGTPLATIAVVTKELMRDAKPTDPHYEDVVLLRAQAERCRDILAELAARGEQIDIIVSRLPVSHLIEEVVAPHRLVAVPIEVRTGPAPGVDAGERSRSRAGHAAQSGRPLWSRQSFGECRRLRRHQGRGRCALVGGRDQDRHRRRRLGLPALRAGAARRAVRHHAARAELPPGGARRAYRHGARLLHRQDVA